jgi:hypothetical protein
MKALHRGTALALAPLALFLFTAGTASATTTQYAVGKPLCGQPAKGHASCFAMRRVIVKKSTPGAQAFTLPSGAVKATPANSARPAVTKAATLGPSNGYTPSDFATAYGINESGGTGQTVAIVDAYNDPDINSDLQTFDSQYSLPTCSEANNCLTVVAQDGSSNLPADNTGWAGEESLDVETVHSVCQGCKIILIEATTNSYANLTTAENEAVTLGATEITNSYGGPEGGTTSLAGAYNHPGIVITASTGDDGYYDFDQLASNGIVSQPNFPASLNTVVAVGGTTLDLAPSGARQDETVWNDNGGNDYFEQLTGDKLGAGGGGCSTQFTAQRWQTHEPGWSATLCSTMRLDADVSADADYLTGFDVYDTDGASGWQTIGGTSLASPLIAAIYGLAGGAKNVPYPASDLYGHPGALYDVTSGGNGWCDGNGPAGCANPNSQGEGILDCAYTAGGVATTGDRACDAAKGYDGPSGLGAPNRIVAFEKAGPLPTVAGPTSIAHGVQGSWTASVTDPIPGAILSKSYRWDWGDSFTTTTTTASASHTYGSPGIYKLTLTARDTYGIHLEGYYTINVS